MNPETTVEQGPSLGAPASGEGQPRFIELNARAKVELRGRDRAAFLQNFCTNDVVKTPVGAGCEAFLLTAQARIVARLLIYVGSDALWLDADPGRAQPIVQHLQRYLISEQVEMFDRTSDHAQFHAVGPNVAAALACSFPGIPVPPYELAHIAFSFADLPAQLRRNSMLGQPGFDIIVPAAKKACLKEALTAAGISPMSPETFEVLRVEAGTPAFGQDIDETNLPQELNRDAQAISYSKGCYLGQETVARIRSYGHVNRLLVGITFEGDSPVPAGAKLLRGGQEVGKVTSGVVSPRFGSIALAYVRRGHNLPGTELAVDQPAGQRTGRVVSLPFAAEKHAGR